MKSLSRVQLFKTPWTLAYQAPPSMGFSRQEYWSGLPFPSPNKAKPKVSRKSDIIKIRAEIHEKEMKETIENINKTISWFIEKINKIEKPLARLIKKKKKEKTQTNETRNEKGEATTDEAELHGLKGDYHKQLLIISVGSGL